MNKKAIWFVLAVLLQTLILMLVPARQVHARLTGKEITVKTAPVDPYDFLSGYHVILSYDISQPPVIVNEPWPPKPRTVYVVVCPDPNNEVWVFDSVHDRWPDEVGADKLVIKGKAEYRRIRYGIENYFVPEGKRGSIEHDLRNNRSNTYADIKVDRFGNAALIRLRVGDAVYEY